MSEKGSRLWGIGILIIFLVFITGMLIGAILGFDRNPPPAEPPPPAATKQQIDDVLKLIAEQQEGLNRVSDRIKHNDAQILDAQHRLDAHVKNSHTE